MVVKKIGQYMSRLVRNESQNLDLLMGLFVVIVAIGIWVIDLTTLWNGYDLTILSRKPNLNVIRVYILFLLKEIVH